MKYTLARQNHADLHPRPDRSDVRFFESMGEGLHSSNDHPPLDGPIPHNRPCLPVSSLLVEGSILA